MVPQTTRGWILPTVIVMNIEIKGPISGSSLYPWKCNLDLTLWNLTKKGSFYLWDLFWKNQTWCKCTVSLRDFTCSSALDFVGNTVDGRNPAPVDMVNIPLFTRFYACWVVQDFFHQQYNAPFFQEYPRLDPPNKQFIRANSTRANSSESA